MIYRNATEIVHDDVFLALPDFLPGSDVFLKIEGLNPASSIKFKAAINLVEQAEKKGTLLPGVSRVVESSSGNLGIALSIVCAIKGYPLTVVADLNTVESAVLAMEALGAEVVIIEEPDANGGFLHKRLALVDDMLKADPRLVWLNQYKSRANVEAHKDTTARSIDRELGPIDYLFVGVGTSGTLMGCLEYRRENRLSHRVVGVDAEGSITFGGSSKRRYIPGLGSSRLPEIYSDDGSFHKVLVPEDESVAQCHHVARTYGLLVGGSTGTVLAGVRRMRDEIPLGSRVVVISPDLGDKYLSTLYSERWLNDHPTLIKERSNV
ncbi:2,3-diaminopropionate biosynthesis protein SbnA [Streptomyces sp. NPDC003444]|uniref:2,3-diaminopropionate biosynthesis protein SbnA n=1 Tax=unclassified Streptomyces TaxID=2593676 RepID=UPI000EF83591|nr:2,3-diaminopropionate biosynthesis protein SbnA [Streptomyces sp. S1]